MIFMGESIVEISVLGKDFTSHGVNKAKIQATGPSTPAKEKIQCPPFDTFYQFRRHILDGRWDILS